LIFDWSENNLQFVAYLKFQLNGVVTDSDMSGQAFFTPAKWTMLAFNLVGCFATLFVVYKRRKTGSAPGDQTPPGVELEDSGRPRFELSLLVSSAIIVLPPPPAIRHCYKQRLFRW
jgi:hypothetical protein